LDSESGPAVDLVGDCCDLLGVLDGSCEVVYASHVYEHLSWSDLKTRALPAARRVLQPGGRLCVSVPDMSTLCRLYVDPEVSHAGRWQVQKFLFGGQTGPHDFHRVGLAWENLYTLLTFVGFGYIKRVPSFGFFEDCSVMEYAGVPISLNVEAFKSLRSTLTV